MTAGPQGRHSTGQHLGPQWWRQMHPDRHHQIHALRGRVERRQIAAAGLDRHAAALRQMHGVAPLALRQAEHVARRQGSRPLPQVIIGLLAVGVAGLGVAAIPEAVRIR